MSNGVDILAAQLQKTINEKDEGKKQGYDSQATVVKVADDTIWVKIPGGVDETPVSKTVSAKEGDTVQVRVAGGRAWIVGNYTAPATDDTRAEQASGEARAADANATRAAGLAQSAQDSANLANQAAIAATASAEEARERAIDADNAAAQALDFATEAGTAAVAATAASTQASIFANSALNQLGIVENVIGVLDMLSQNGEYGLSEDTEVNGEKWYFTRSGSGTDADPYIYTVIENPYGSPVDNGWYELLGITDSIQNFISSHLAVDSKGLWVQQGATKVLLSSTEGIELYGAQGTVVGKYGETAQIGDISGFHIEIDGTELGFYQAQNKVAYINNNQLYITKSVVLQQMDLGVPIDTNGNGGMWSWKVHPNSETPWRYNLNLKWVG